MRGFELFLFWDEDFSIEEFEDSAFLSYLFVEELEWEDFLLKELELSTPLDGCVEMSNVSDFLLVVVFSSCEENLDILAETAVFFKTMLAFLTFEYSGLDLKVWTFSELIIASGGL